jgi:hypothetical protein
MKGRVIAAVAAISCCLSGITAEAQQKSKFDLSSDLVVLAPGQSARIKVNKDGKEFDFATDPTFRLVVEPPQGLTCDALAKVCTAPPELGKGLWIAGDVSIRALVDDQEVAFTRITLTEKPVSYDVRDDFEATFYTGASIDSFAAQDLNKYLNPDDSGTKKLGYVAGVDFAYRFLGDRRNAKSPQLWVYGQTVHGQRSAEVDCAQDGENELPAQCTLNGFTPKPGAFLGILRNASSLEAFAGARLEILPLQVRGQNAAKLYLKSELGFFTVSKSGGDVFDSHQKIAFGALATGGRYRDSFLEAAWGKSDVFAFHPGRRFKIGGYLTWDLASWMSNRGMKPYIEITLDSDFSKGADSVRTYYGFNFDLQRLTNPVTSQ